jgi:hypothetical protein
MEYVLIGILIAIGFYFAPVILGFVAIVIGAIFMVIVSVFKAIFGGNNGR